MRSARLSLWICTLALVAACGCGGSRSDNGAASNSANAGADQAPAPKQETRPPIIVPEGTSISITVDQTVSSKDTQPGQHVAASLAEPIIVDGLEAIPRGAKVSGTITNAKSAGRFKGNAELGITLASIEVGGQRYTIHTTTFSDASKGRGKRTAEGAGIGAGAGALIGALAGGGKGAAIGAAAGGGAGVGGAALTGNRDVTIAAETKLRFKLTKALEIPQS
jgi:hypothetical protein